MQSTKSKSTQFRRQNWVEFESIVFLLTASRRRNGVDLKSIDSSPLWIINFFFRSFLIMRDFVLNQKLGSAVLQSTLEPQWEDGIPRHWCFLPVQLILTVLQTLSASSRTRDCLSKWGRFAIDLESTIIALWSTADWLFVDVDMWSIKSKLESITEGLNFDSVSASICSRFRVRFQLLMVDHKSMVCRRRYVVNYESIEEVYWKTQFRPHVWVDLLSIWSRVSGLCGRP